MDAVAPSVPPFWWWVVAASAFAAAFPLLGWALTSWNERLTSDELDWSRP